MRKNAHTGTVTIQTSGGDVRLRFDWEGIAALHGAYGKTWETEVSRIINDLDAKGLSVILAIASEHDEAWWMEQSPPFVPTAKAVQEALHLAFFGAGSLESNPPLARRLMTRFANLFAFGPNSAGVQQTSGA